MVKLRHQVAYFFTADREEKIDRTISNVHSILSFSATPQLRAHTDEEASEQSH